jgi:2,5-diamino-6-(ribosylamino)-4(3H)-pyrimidinone 5'-phosphate reductase
MATTIDGHVAHPTGAWEFGSKEDRRRMDRLREWADCLIVSRKTLEHDNMNLSVRTKPHSKRHPRPIIVANSDRPFKPGLRVTSRAAYGGEVWLSNGARGTTIESMWPDLGAQWDINYYDKVGEIVSALVKRGYKRLLLEGGPTLNGYFFEQNLVDEFYVTLLPIAWAGDTHDRAIFTNKPLPLQKFRLRNAEKRGNEMFLRYVRKLTPSV